MLADLKTGLSMVMEQNSMETEISIKENILMAFLRAMENMYGATPQCIKEISNKGQETDMEFGREAKRINKYIKVII